MIKLRLITENSLGSAIIRWYSNSDWSHVDIGMPDGTFLGARLKGGVQVRSADYIVPSRILWLGIDTTALQEAEFYGWAKSQIGKPYDWEGILSFAFNEDWRNGTSWFCSMFVFAALDHVGLAPLRLKYASKCTPGDLAMSLNLQQTTAW